MKKILLFFSFLFILTCAKEDSQAPNTPPTQIVKQYTLTASAEDGGSVIGGGTYTSGTQVSLTATPNSGYSFSGWSNGSTANPLTVTLNSNTSITANFEIVINYFSFSLLFSEGGTVSSSIESPVTGTYEEGTEITLIATASDGYQFMGWSDGNLLPERSILIDSNLEIEALFDQVAAKH